MEAPATTTDDPLIGRTLGEFVVRAPLGQGGFGAVYRAEQPLLAREAVIKIVHARLRRDEAVTQRFLREARLASRLDHPYAAHVYAFGAEPDGLLWIAMELVRGTPLDRFLREHGAIPLERFVPLLERLCEVVQSAHDHGIVHRDLKPANVMVLARSGRLLPKLLDFGIAKLRELEPERPPPASQAHAPAPAPASENPATADTIGATGATGASTVDALDASAGPLTQDGATIGSPPYMAPEQWRDAAGAGAPADLYALAVLSYEALTGKRPFRGDSLRELAAAHARAAPPPLPEPLPAALNAFFARALAKRPEQRFDSALALAAAFREASGLASEPEALPQLDEAVRAATTADAPQPIAEAVAQLEAARTPHQAREAVETTVRTVALWLGLIAVAARSRVGPGAPADAAGAVRLLRELRRRQLEPEEWLSLARELLRPFASKRDAHPLPELVSLFFDVAGAETGFAAGLAALLGHSMGVAREHDLIAWLGRVLPELSAMLRSVAFLADYPLCVQHGAELERYTGVRRPFRVSLRLAGAGPGEGLALLADAGGRPVLSLAPLVSVEPPSPGAELEPFLLTGRGRHGARFVALPIGHERHDERVWAWLGAAILGEARAEAEAAVEIERPYRGLAAFTEADAALYFGREREAEAFVNRLRTTPLLAVVGPSGVGKSSFVSAGVVPRLPADWQATRFRPGRAPLEALAARLEEPALAARLADDPRELVAALGARAAASGATQVLIVDQLEELVTMCGDARQRERFAEALAGCAEAHAPVRVVVTLRDDFLVRIAELPGLRGVVGQGLQLLATPALDELVRILEEPARRAGYGFEEAELPRRMAEEVAGEPAALALLSFTASQLWELRDRHFKQLPSSTYRAIGGVGGALARHADETLAAMPAERQRVAREAFRHLVTADGTRAALSRAELRQLTGDDARADEVIDALVGARLLTSAESEAGDRIEIVHEALVSAWPRLVAWRREDAEGARLRDQVREAARQWQERGRPRGLLWRGEALAEYRLWRARYPGQLTAAEEAFGQASLADERRGRRLRRALLVGAFVVLAAAVVMLVTLNRRGETERRRAERSEAATRARVARQYLDQARLYLLDEDPQRAGVLLAAAVEAGESGAQVAFMQGRIEQLLAARRRISPRRTGSFSADPSAGTVVAGAADGSVLLLDARSGAVRASFAAYQHGVERAELVRPGLLFTFDQQLSAKLWSLADGAPVCSLSPVTSVWRISRDGAWLLGLDEGRPRLFSSADCSPAATASLPADAPAVLDAQFTAEPDAVVVATDDGAIRRWSLGGKPEMVLWPGRGPVTGAALALSPDGKRLGWADHSGQVALFEIATGRILFEQRRRHGTGRARAPQFSPDGQRALVIDGNDVYLLDANSGEQLSMLRRHRGAIVRAAFSPDGRRVVTGGADATARLWEVESGRLVATLTLVDSIDSVAFAPDGAGIFVGNPEGAWLWRPGDDMLLQSIAGSGAEVWAVDFSPDGERLLTGALDGTLRLLETASGRELASRRIDGELRAIRRVELSGDGKLALSAGDDGMVRLWDPAGELAPRGELKHEGMVPFASFSPDGATIAAASGASVVLWDVRSQQSTRTIGDAAGQFINTVLFSPDGTRLITASQDGAAHVFATQSGERLLSLAHDEGSVCAALSPDGQRLVTATLKRGLLWDASTGEPLAPLEGHSGWVSSAVFGPTGLVVSAGDDRSVRIWSGESGRLLAVLEGHSQGVIWATFSRDGSRIASAAADGTVRVWRVPLATDGGAGLARLAAELPYELSGGLLVPKRRGD